MNSSKNQIWMMNCNLYLATAEVFFEKKMTIDDN
ncbi:hypothetical protein EV198_3714 [Roseivirga ehrenbergii]|nr:hypothetical protein EV198_3714 [Roseivirga ehrenbergii]